MSDEETDDRSRIDLTDVGRVGEEYAQPLPVERVRRLGQQRRTRRQLAIGGAAVATVLVAAVAAFGSGVLTTEQAPEPAVTPSVVTASPVPTTVSAPVRTVTTDNLITPADVPVVGREKYAATIDADDREGDRFSVCTPREGGLSSLGSTQVVDQNFVLTRRADGSKNPMREPFNGEPTVFTRAMQFESATASQVWMNVSP